MGEQDVCAALLKRPRRPEAPHRQAAPYPGTERSSPVRPLLLGPKAVALGTGVGAQVGACSRAPASGIGLGSLRPAQRRGRQGNSQEGMYSPHPAASKAQTLLGPWPEGGWSDAARCPLLQSRRGQEAAALADVARSGTVRSTWPAVATRLLRAGRTLKLARVLAWPSAAWRRTQRSGAPGTRPALRGSREQWPIGSSAGQLEPSTRAAPRWQRTAAGARPHLLPRPARAARRLEGAAPRWRL